MHNNVLMKILNISNRKNFTRVFSNFVHYLNKSFSIINSLSISDEITKFTLNFNFLTKILNLIKKIKLSIVNLRHYRVFPGLFSSTLLSTFVKNYLIKLPPQINSLNQY